MTGHWTIGELALAVQQALATTSYPGQKSARVREVPDRRTIRYYTTIGLLDKPAEMRGRTAYYGRRHLLQLVAIKRLQALGKSLVEIQAELTGASDSALLKCSGSLEGSLAAIEQQVAESPQPVLSTSSEERKDFWSATPDVVKQKQEPPVDATAALHLKVLDNVTLVIKGAEADALDEETLSRLQPALENLKNILAHDGGVIARERQDEKEPNAEIEQSQANDNEREQS